MEPLRLIVYSDYLCPWCYLGTVRLRRIGEEFGDRVQFEWRSFLLRPEPDPRRTLEKFRAYTQSWQRVAAEPDAPPFRVWQSDAGPPSHSIPPHLVAKAAATVGPDAFHRMHDRLMQAYFTENRDITDRRDTPRACGESWDYRRTRMAVRRSGAAAGNDRAAQRGTRARHRWGPSRARGGPRGSGDRRATSGDVPPLDQPHPGVGCRCGGTGLWPVPGVWTFGELTGTWLVVPLPPGPAGPGGRGTGFRYGALTSKSQGGGSSNRHRELPLAERTVSRSLLSLSKDLQ